MLDVGLARCSQVYALYRFVAELSDIYARFPTR